MKNKIKALYIFLYLNISFTFCKIRANSMHKLTGKRYHVLQMSEKKLIIVDNNWVNVYNNNVKRIKGGKKINIFNLLQMSLYSTSTKSIIRK
jgi:hypothetical protein